jgi:hypothetical protein
MLKDKYERYKDYFDKGFNKLLNQALHKIKSVKLNEPGMS